MHFDSLRLALDAHAIVTHTTPDGTITDVNQRCCDATGYSREELVGQNLRIINSGYHPRAFWTEMFETLAREGVWRGEVCNRKKTGELYWLRSTNVAVRDPNGRLTGYVSIRTEITDYKEQTIALKDALAFTEALVNSVPDAIVATDTKGVITAFNAGAEAMSGFRAADVVNRHTPALWHVPAELAARAEQLTRELGRKVEPGLDALVARVRESRCADEHEWTFIRKDFTRLPVRLAITPVIDATGEMIGYLGLAHDISAQRAHEQALAEAAQAAEAASHAKSRFLANMSHEIRTPLNGVLGMNALLLDTALDEVQRGYAETIQRSGRALLDVITDVLDFSRIEAERVEIESIDFEPRALAVDVADVLRVTARQRGITLVLDLGADVPLQLRGDPTRVRQVLMNMVANAVKFSADGGVVTMRLTTMLRMAASDGSDTATIRYEVEDRGIGIAADALQRLFTPFTQADATTTRRFGGSGLGLAICKRLTDMMRGQIGATSRLGEGSTFWFTIPGAVVPHSAATAAARAADSPAEPFASDRQDSNGLVRPRESNSGFLANSTLLAGCRILVAEDDEVNQLVIRTMLEKLGAEVVLAGDGRTAVERCAEQQFDAVLMDFQMPEMDGLDATRAIRAAESSRQAGRTPIVALTANAMRTARNEGTAAGMDDYLTKPIDRDRLVASLVRHVLNRTPAQVFTPGAATDGSPTT